MKPDSKSDMKPQTENLAKRATATTLLDKVRLAARRHIDASGLRSAKVWVVMGTLSLAIIFTGHSASTRYGLLIGFLLALSLNSIVFFYGDLRLSNLFTGHELEGRDPWGLLRQVQELARKIGVRAPHVVLIESETPLAFSAGLIPTRSTIFISVALIEKLEPAELTTVLAHELIKFKSDLTASATAASALAGLLSHTASTLDDVVMLRFLNRKKGLTRGGIAKGPMTLLVSPFVALLIRSSVARSAVLEADGETVRLTGDGRSFAQALYKLDAYVKTRPVKMNIAEAHLFTVSPLSNSTFWHFASAQPSLEVRVKNITGRFPV
jgi:heat shock protein HtpX